MTSLSDVIVQRPIATVSSVTASFHRIATQRKSESNSHVKKSASYNRYASTPFYYVIGYVIDVYRTLCKANHCGYLLSISLRSVLAASLRHDALRDDENQHYQLLSYSVLVV